MKIPIGPYLISALNFELMVSKIMEKILSCRMQKACENVCRIQKNYLVLESIESYQGILI